MDGGACAVVAGEAGQTTCRKKLTSHVRKIQEEREEAPVQGISEADEAGEEACRGRPRPRRQLQEDRGAAGKVALDRARRGREAPLRLVAEGAGRGACARRGARGCMPQARRMAQMLQRMQPQEGLRMQQEAARVLRCPPRAEGGRCRPLGGQEGRRRDRGQLPREGGGDRGLPRTRALARADRACASRARQVRLHDLRMDRPGLCRALQHGAQEQGVVQAQEAQRRRRQACLPPFPRQVAQRLLRPSRGHPEGRLGDGHGGRQEGARQAVPAHPVPPPHELPACAAARREDACMRRGGARARQPRARRSRRHAQGVRHRAHGQRRGVLRRGRAGGHLRRAAGRDEALLLRHDERLAEGRMREEPLRDQEDPPQGEGHHVRQARRGGLLPAHGRGQFRDPGQGRLVMPVAQASGGLRARCEGAPRCIPYRAHRPRQDRPRACMPG